MTTGWVIGYVVGGVIVLAVVVLLLLMIRGASRAADKAESILAALHDSRDNTEPLWAVHDVNQAIDRVTNGAAAVREHIEAKSGAVPQGTP
jgi:hypothetical protein